MNYTLHQIEVFVTVKKTQSITKAAQELHLSQPAISLQLKKFQDQFDIPLTEYVGRKIYITEFGNEIAKAGQKILDEISGINSLTLAHKGKLTGTLKISVVSTGKYVMPYFLADFLNRHDGIHLQMDVTNKSKVIESLQLNEVDFALVSLIPTHLMLEGITLMQNKLYVVGNVEKTFERKLYKPTLLEEFTMIYREQGSATRQVMEDYLIREKLRVKKKIELTSNEAVKQAVLSGMGYSIMPLIGIKNEIENGQLQIIPVIGFPIISSWNLVWNKQKNFSPVATSFSEYVKKSKNEVIEKSFDGYEKY